MNAETRAKELANAMARHIIGENFAAGDETCVECVAMVLKALRHAENDKLDEAAALLVSDIDGSGHDPYEACLLRSAAMIRALKKG